MEIIGIICMLNSSLTGLNKVVYIGDAGNNIVIRPKDNNADYVSFSSLTYDGYGVGIQTNVNNEVFNFSALHIQSIKYEWNDGSPRMVVTAIDGGRFAIPMTLLG